MFCKVDITFWDLHSFEVELPLMKRHIINDIVVIGCVQQCVISVQYKPYGPVRPLLRDVERVRVILVGDSHATQIFQTWNSTVNLLSNKLENNNVFTYMFYLISYIY